MRKGYWKELRVALLKFMDAMANLLIDLVYKPLIILACIKYLFL